MLHNTALKAGISFWFHYLSFMVLCMLKYNWSLKMITSLEEMQSLFFLWCLLMCPAVVFCYMMVFRVVTLCNFIDDYEWFVKPC